MKYLNGSLALLDGDYQVGSAIISVSFTFLCFKIIASVISILLNSFVAIIIVCYRELKCKTRNICLLFIILSDLVGFIPPLLEIVYLFYPSDERFYSYYAAIRYLPTVLVLLNTFFSLLDRYVANQYQLWHLEKVTVPRVTFWLLICFGITVVINMHVYIFQPVKREYQVQLLTNELTNVMTIFLLILCIIARIVVYFQTRNLLQKSKEQVSTVDPIPNLSVAPSAESNPISVPEIVIELNDLDEATSSPIRNDHLNTTLPHFSAVPAVDQVIIELNELDEDATSSMGNCRNEEEVRGRRLGQETTEKLKNQNIRSTIAGVASLLIFTSPFLVLNLILNICRKVQACALLDRLSSLAPYFEQWNQILSVYNPFMHLIWNKELSLVLKKCHTLSNFKIRGAAPAGHTIEEEKQQEYHHSASHQNVPELP